MKKYLLSAVLLIAGLVSSNAANVVLSKGTGAGINVLSSTGASLSSFTIFVGTFASAPTAFNAGNFASVASSFIEFGNAAAPGTGLLTGTIARTDFTGAAAASNFNNRQVYVIVANTSSLASATEAGLFTKSAIRTDYIFPADTPGALANIGASTINFGAISPIGDTTAIDAVPTTTPDSLKLAFVGVPEPSTGLVAMLGLGLLAVRRRK